MIICLCHRVSDRDLQREASRCRAFQDLQPWNGVGTGCGQCLGHARAIYDRTQGAAQAGSAGGASIVRLVAQPA